MPKELSASARKVQEVLRSRGFNSEVVELPDSTRTAKEAAAGTPFAVFRLTPPELQEMTNGEIVSIK